MAKQLLKAQGLWTEGNTYLLKWDTEGTVITSNGERSTRIAGEAVFVVRGNHETIKGFFLDRMGLACSGVEARKDFTGVITVRALSSTGSVKPSRKGYALRLRAACDINYESLDRMQKKEIDKGCYYEPALEPAAMVIDGSIVEKGGALYLSSGTLHVSCMAGESQEVIAIDVPFDSVKLQKLPASKIHYHFDKDGNWQQGEDSNVDSNVCISQVRRQLRIQPVGFLSSPTDPSPSGSTAAAQFATAQTVWTKACIDLVILPFVNINNATLKTSSNLTDIRNAYTDPNPNVIEVFFVSNPLAATGGGNAGGIGVASCKPVIAEPNAGNPVLLAHELGHVLGLFHPGAGSISDPDTVMDPTGSAMVPGTELVTHIMCTSIANPVLQTTTTSSCLSHDIPNHYLRDFPTDVGNEPSEPLGAGMNRYSMSNVWNRLTNTPGTPSAATGPEHQHPVRFNADLTPRMNFLFARVEQLVNLPIRNAVVKFFLKTPGSGGGATNLQLLGQVPVPSGLVVGSSQVVSMSWTVPTGTPSHSCVFAVVRSDAEPEGDQSSLDWWQFETLSYSDNDWAQRNLDIENMSSSNDSNVGESGPFVVYLPPPNERPAQSLTLEVDSQNAGDLRSLVIEVVGMRSYKVVPGKIQSISINISDIRERLVVVIHGEIKPNAKEGTIMTVGVNPSIGKRRFVGWASQFKVASQRESVAQTLDNAAAAFGDLAGMLDLPHVHSLFCGLGRTPCKRPYSINDLAKDISSNRETILGALFEMQKDTTAGSTGLPSAGEKLLKAIERFSDGGASAEAVTLAFRSFCNRAMITAALLMEKKK